MIKYGQMTGFEVITPPIMGNKMIACSLEIPVGVMLGISNNLRYKHEMSPSRDGQIWTKLRSLIQNSHLMHTAYRFQEMKY